MLGLDLLRASASVLPLAQRRGGRGRRQDDPAALPTTQLQPAHDPVATDGHSCQMCRTRAGLGRRSNVAYSLRAVEFWRADHQLDSTSFSHCFVHSFHKSSSLGLLLIWERRVPRSYSFDFVFVVNIFDQLLVLICSFALYDAAPEVTS